MQPFTTADVLHHPLLRPTVSSIGYTNTASTPFHGPPSQPASPSLPPQLPPQEEGEQWWVESDPLQVPPEDAQGVLLFGESHGCTSLRRCVMGA